MMYKLLSIAAGGAIGAVLRYGVAGVVQSCMVSMYPWGTLAVNLIGSFLAGLLWALAEYTYLPPQLKTFMFIGILGGFTTFSTYMLETFHLMREGEYFFALGNILLSNLLGIVLVFSGVMLSERIVQYFK
jgi:CrcB protein